MRPAVLVAVGAGDQFFGTALRMVSKTEGIAEKAELEEQRADFDAEANARFAKIAESGKSIPWNPVSNGKH